jgi:hypothetical protein
VQLSSQPRLALHFGMPSAPACRNGSRLLTGAVLGNGFDSSAEWERRCLTLARFVLSGTDG